MQRQRVLRLLSLQRWVHPNSIFIVPLCGLKIFPSYTDQSR